MSQSQLDQFLGYLGEALREEAKSLFIPESFEKDQYIFVEQDEATHFYLVEEGIVEANIVHGDGRLYIMSFLHPGDIFGEAALQEEGVYSYSAVAHSDCRAWRISWDDIQWIASRDPRFSLHLARLVAQKLDQSYYKERCIAGERVERRIACILLKMAGEKGISDKCGLSIGFPLTNRDIAGLVGSTEETVSRILSRFKKEGLIASEDRKITILDVTALNAHLDQAM